VSAFQKQDSFAAGLDRRFHDFAEWPADAFGIMLAHILSALIGPAVRKPTVCAMGEKKTANACGGRLSEEPAAT
jgi:hypothetical protein